MDTLETKEQVCSYPLILAGKTSHRLRGLLGTKVHKSALLLMPCKDIHTFGMTHPIDVAFISDTGFVLATYRDVVPAQRLHHPWAEGVIERFSDAEQPWFSVGDHVAIHT